MSLALVLLVAGTLVAAALDLKWRRIPNVLTAAMAIGAIALHVNGLPALLLAIGAMGAAFALGALAFSAGWFGGGDVKLVSAACGLVSYPGCVGLVVAILIAGAVLALGQAVAQRRLVTFVRNASTLARTGARPETVTLLPYGVAIAAGSSAYVFATLFPSMRLPL